MTERPAIRAGWRDDGLEEAIEIISAIPELNAVLERESALLAQNVVSAIMSRAHEDHAATLTNNETKKVLARSMLVGLQANISSALDAKSAMLAEVVKALEDAMPAFEWMYSIMNGGPKRSATLAKLHNARTVLAKIKGAQIS